MTTEMMTAAPTTDGECVLVTADSVARVIRFEDDDDQVVARYTYAEFAEVRTALALDAGRGIVLADEIVAGLQQWADLDAHGLRATA